MKIPKTQRFKYTLVFNIMWLFGKQDHGRQRAEKEGL